MGVLDSSSKLDLIRRLPTLKYPSLSRNGFKANNLEEMPFSWVLFFLSFGVLSGDAVTVWCDNSAAVLAATTLLVLLTF